MRGVVFEVRVADREVDVAGGGVDHTEDVVAGAVGLRRFPALRVQRHLAAAVAEVGAALGRVGLADPVGEDLGQSTDFGFEGAVLFVEPQGGKNLLILFLVPELAVQAFDRHAHQTLPVGRE